MVFDLIALRGSTGLKKAPFIPKAYVFGMHLPLHDRRLALELEKSTTFKNVGLNLQSQLNSANFLNPLDKFRAS